MPHVGWATSRRASNPRWRDLSVSGAERRFHAHDLAVRRVSGQGGWGSGGQPTWEKAGARAQVGGGSQDWGACPALGSEVGGQMGTLG